MKNECENLISLLNNIASGYVEEKKYLDAVYTHCI